MSDDVAQAALYLCGVADGRGLERAAIVAWIRMNDPDWPVIDIERGDHLRGDDV